MTRRAWDPGAPLPLRTETGPAPEKWAARDGVMQGAPRWEGSTLRVTSKGVRVLYKLDRWD